MRPLASSLRRLAIVVPTTVAALIWAAVAMSSGTEPIDLLTHADVRIRGTDGRDLAGAAVAGAGDVNGDGRDDVIVGAPEARNHRNHRSGVAYVIFGGASARRVDLDDLGAAGFRIVGVAAGDRVGAAVAGAGDVNGDGRDDVIVGAPEADAEYRWHSGAAYVLFGRSSTGTIDLRRLGRRGFRIAGAAAGDEAGASVAGPRDLNGDGHADLLVGAPEVVAVAGRRIRRAVGSAYLVFGSASPRQVDLFRLGRRGFAIFGAGEDDQAGGSVAGAGDVNGDRRPDLVVAAQGRGIPRSSRRPGGAVYVVFGKRSPGTVRIGQLGRAGFVIRGTGLPFFSTPRVAGAGDVNGDGRGDVLVTGARSRGRGRRARAVETAWVVFGRGGTAPVNLAALGGRGFPIAGRVLRGVSSDDRGMAIAAAGDVNQDRLDDVVLGAERLSLRGRSGCGSAFLLYGRRSARAVDLRALGRDGVRINGPTRGDALGYAVAGAGDVNGDGREDLIFGAPRTNERIQRSGSAYVLYGRGWQPRR